MLPNPISLPWTLCLLRGLPLPRKLGLLEKLYGNDLAAYGITTVSCANGHVWTLDFREVTIAGLFTVITKARVRCIGSGSGWPWAVSL